jgi:hypothetical protein
VHGEKGWGPRGRRQRSTGRRSGTLTDDSGALVEVGGALQEDGGMVGGEAVLGEDGRWCSVRYFGSLTASFRFAPRLKKFSECGCYI